jgi:large subunit ribosomal protein L19
LQKSKPYDKVAVTSFMNIKHITISPIDVEARKKLDLRSGDTVKVWQKIKEGDKTRLQAFEGLVLARKHGSEPGATFTVRKVASGVGVEKIFPLYSPMIDKIDILRRSKVRRAKLYHIRDKAAKEISREMRRTVALRTGKADSESTTAEASSEAADVVAEATA